MTAAVAAQARRLVRACDRAALATAQHDADGWPYASLVMCASDFAGAPLMLLSDLAEHVRNLKRDGRASLLFDATVGLDEPLAGARLTVLGRIERCAEPAARARYLARHPSAAGYAGFADFGLWRLEPVRAHLVAGFGAIHWVDGDALLVDAAGAEALAAAEGEIVAHMNTDHGDALSAYAAGLLGRGGGGWTMTGIDPEGLDLRRGAETARIAFAAPVDGPGAARAELVRLAGVARAGLAGDGAAGGPR